MRFYYLQVNIIAFGPSNGRNGRQHHGFATRRPLSLPFLRLKTDRSTLNRFQAQGGWCVRSGAPPRLEIAIAGRHAAHLEPLVPRRGWKSRLQAVWMHTKRFSAAPDDRKLQLPTVLVPTKRVSPPLAGLKSRLPTDRWPHGQAVRGHCSVTGCYVPLVTSPCHAFERESMPRATAPSHEPTCGR